MLKNISTSSLEKNPTLYHTLTILIDKCRSMSELKQIHALSFTSGSSQDDIFASKLISFSALSDSGNVDYSFRVLAHLSFPTIFNWNTVIRGYSNSKNPSKSSLVFVRMLRNGISPDYLTYPFLAKASARVSDTKHGLAVHARVAKTGHESDRYIQNSLIHMYASCGNIAYARNVFDEITIKNLVSWNSMLDGYAKCGDLELAKKVFDEMPGRDVVSWSSMIDGYVKRGDHNDALVMFERMRVEGPKANEVTMVSVLCACAHLGALDQGKIMHNYMIENELPINLALRTSLVDMFAKCGAIEEALVMFRDGLKNKTDVLIWNAVIGGLATHGLVNESLEIFKEMQINGIAPDEITYLCLLSACAHGGIVKEAWFFFNSLGKCSMTPKSEHYACMVDVLARAGQIAQAYEFLCQMPVEPNASILGALLSGCVSHGRSDLAEIIGKKLIELEPDHDGRYVGLSNAYAVVKRWDDARTMRRIMESRGVKKSPGCSLVEIAGRVNRFIAHDKTHPCLEEIYGMLGLLVDEMKLDKSEEQFFHGMEIVY